MPCTHRCHFMVILMPSSKIHQNQLQQIHAHSHSMQCSLALLRFSFFTNSHFARLAVGRALSDSFGWYYFGMKMRWLLGVRSRSQLFACVLRADRTHEEQLLLSLTCDIVYYCDSLESFYRTDSVIDGNVENFSRVCIAVYFIEHL